MSDDSMTKDVQRDGTRPVIAVFGGSFDPPHTSHVLAAAYVEAVLAPDRLLVVPTWQHPFGKRSHADYEHRLAMCERAFCDFRSVTVSAIERDLGGPSRTLFTLIELNRREPDAELRLVMGADLLAETPRWHAFEDIVRRARPFVIGRSGHEPIEMTRSRVQHRVRSAQSGVPERDQDVPELVLPPLSSTEVRARLFARRPVRGLVPRRVLAYIEEHGLYRSHASEEPAPSGEPAPTGGGEPAPTGGPEASGETSLE